MITFIQRCESTWSQKVPELVHFSKSIKTFKLMKDMEYKSEATWFHSLVRGFNVLSLKLSVWCFSKKKETSWVDKWPPMTVSCMEWKGHCSLYYTNIEALGFIIRTLRWIDICTSIQHFCKFKQISKRNVVWQRWRSSFIYVYGCFAFMHFRVPQAV